MHPATTAVLGLALLGCPADREAGGGQDILPKRGATGSDPTILAAAPSCIVGLGTYRALAIAISASDLRGNVNLGTCQAMFAGEIATGEFNTSNATCYVEVELAGDCVEGTSYIVDLMVANESGGFTTASLRVRP